MPSSGGVVLKVYGDTDASHRDIRDVERRVCDDGNTEQGGRCEEEEDGAEVGSQEGGR